MKKKFFRRILLAGVLLVLLAVGGTAWLLGSSYGRKLIASRVRQQLARNSELVLGPFEVEFSPWRDFPHLTASLHHLALTDTAHGRAVPVLHLGRADARLELWPLLHGRVQVTRLVLSDVALREQVDSLGRSWGLRGRRRPGPGKAPVFDANLDSLIINNFSILTRNGYAHSAIGAHVRTARLAAKLAGGVLQVKGTLGGQLDSVRNPIGTLFLKEPVQAWVRYHYTFAARQGTFDEARFTLRGDTVRLSGTHTVDPTRPTGTQLDLRFAGNQPLIAVLFTALPARLRPYLAGATSPSKAHITYHILGRSGPTTRPRTLLTFNLRNASLIWPDSSRRINHWDLAATYDNGPRHRPETTTLTLQRCRIYSPAGQLDMALLLRNFRQPYVRGRLSGRTELPELAALVAPNGIWQARSGTAALDVQFQGQLKLPTGRRPKFSAIQQSLSARGTVVLHNAALLLPSRNAHLTALNVRIGIADSIWRLTDASGVLDSMGFRATATTTHLLNYLTGQSKTTTISGDFAVADLHLDRLRQMLRPAAGAPPRPNAQRRAQARATLLATLGTNLIPQGVHLDVALHCQRLFLPADTLTEMFVRVRHDGQQVYLRGLTARLYGGEVQGNLTWPTYPLTTEVAPVSFQLAIHFGTLNYQQLISRLKPHRPAPGQLGARKMAALPALRELLLSADGQLDCTIGAVRLPDGEFLRALRLRLVKVDSLLEMPYLTLTVPQGGQGRASASAIVNDLRLTAAAGDVRLHYAALDVQQLLKMLAALNPPDSLITPARRVARQTARTRRATRRAIRGPNRGSMLTNGVLAMTLRVEADQMRYANMQGGQFRLVSHLRNGTARIDTAMLNAFGGRLRLSGVLQTNRGRNHHPLHVQTRVENIQLPEFFTVAQSMRPRLLSGNNIRGTVTLVGDLHTDLDANFLPSFDQTRAFLQADIHNLELIDVEALTQSLKVVRKARSGHLYFEPVRAQFVLDRGEVLIPGLTLNSNLTNMAVNGTYALDGRANLFIGANAVQMLFGDNKKRIARIKNGESLAPRPHPGLTYVNLRRGSDEAKYQVRLFKKEEQRQQQIQLRLQARQFLITQRLDTTLRMVP